MAARTRKRTRKRTQEEMTPEQARTFDSFSEKNAGILLLASEERGCSCDPYVDWYTYRRWRVQGFQVQKGEKSTKIPVIKKWMGEDKETGKEREISYKGNASVFCRCQVKPVGQDN
jgi:antirestriction protein ArdC